MTLDEEKIYNEFHSKCEQLTGDPWCPYPSIDFMKAILKLSDDKYATDLINERRKYTFPVFLLGEPQSNDIIEILKLEN